METLELLRSQMNVKDIIDILIVAILVYQVLLIIHGTRAVQMLFGIGVLIMLFWVGLYYKLYALNWILNHFFDSFLIICIVLFQEEIRSALVQFGARGGVLGITVGGKNEEVPEIEEVVEAVRALSLERVGALIVIERRTGLMNYIESGTKIESKIHSDLIYAIFQSSSPLHDGAIIIQGNELKAAGCFLPLSKNVEVERHMGTRHRAALGMSEITDAIVITVSEETGNINVCVDGVFYLCEIESVLRKYLKHLWYNEPLDERLKPVAAKEL